MISPPGAPANTIMCEKGPWQSVAFRYLICLLCSEVQNRNKMKATVRSCCMVQERTEFDEPDYALIDTLFSLAEAHLFMQIIELMESKPGIMPPNKTFADIYR